MRFLVVFFLAYLSLCAFGQDPVFDHQTQTYQSYIQPETLQSESVSVTSFFSPDHSVDTLTKLIESAKISVDIGIPSWSSWSNCTPFNSGGGCSFEEQRNGEEFPVFQALLNALHRGVKVRILTNNVEQWPTTGSVYPLSFLSVAGATVKYYTSTTFYHAKYIMVDGDEAAISSVNFSYTSFMENREAGVVLSGSSAISSYLLKVFNDDWNNAVAWPVQNYNQSDVNIAKDKSNVPVVIPSPKYFSGAYVSSVKTVDTTVDEISVYASPDFAFEQITQVLNSSKSSIDIYIYQVTDGGFCEVLSSLAQNGITVTILASNRIFSKPDWEAAQKCYGQMSSAGVSIYVTAEDMYSYSHQKYIIVDDESVTMSTGNLGSSDYPSHSTFPPYGQSGWSNTNRDLTVMVRNSQVVANFKTVYTNDFALGSPWHPYKVKCMSCLL